MMEEEGRSGTFALYDDNGCRRRAHPLSAGTLAPSINPLRFWSRRAQLLLERGPKRLHVCAGTGAKLQ